MLKVDNLHAFYGPIEALLGVSLEVKNNEIVCIIGSNGAGKTTLLKAISGAILRTGTVEWNGETISTLSPVRIAKRGLMHVPEGRHVFPGLNVEENLQVGAVSWHGFFGKMDLNDDLEQVYDLFPRLKERRKQLAWSLSGGEQQMLAIGRALMGRPKILLLDEPSMGLAPLVVEELFKKIDEINKVQKIPILLVEQNARLAFQLSDYGYVIERGAITISGKAKELSSDSRILEAYLGKFAKEI
jgi:ABC-type branched-chain amino acid transport systems, ATPase component